jgi:putative glycosyltransferase (TIGR04372 family)
VWPNDRPFRIFAAFLDWNLGDFIARNIYAAAVRMCFKRAKLTVYFRDDRPYKQDVLALNPYIDQVVFGTGTHGLPLEVFHATGRFPIRGTERFFQAGHAQPDLLLVPSMMMAADLLRFDRLPLFAIPKDKQKGQEGRLIQMGLDPEKWFCCVFYRQASYTHRGPAPHRDVDDRPYETLIDWIIDELGGQVVRLGHPEMRRFADRPGFVDLSAVPNDFFLQAAAISRARFMIATPSGPSMLPGVFRVPCALTNALDFQGALNDSDVVLCKHLFDPAGQRVPLASLLREGALHQHVFARKTTREGFRLLDNTTDELKQAARILFARTADTPSWRRTTTGSPGNTDGRFVTPRSFCRAVNFVEFPHLAPSLAKSA